MIAWFGHGWDSPLKRRSFPSHVSYHKSARLSVFRASRITDVFKEIATLPTNSQVNLTDAEEFQRVKKTDYTSRKRRLRCVLLWTWSFAIGLFVIVSVYRQDFDHWTDARFDPVVAPFVKLLVVLPMVAGLLITMWAIIKA